MKKLASIMVLLLTVVFLTGCTEDAEPCGPGTTLVNGVCELIEEDNNPTPNPGTTDLVCSNETGLHSVPGGSPTTISSWLNWRFIGGHIVRDPDNAWIQAGAAVFDVHTVPSEPWIGSFTTSGFFLTKGCQYTFEFTVRTEAGSIKPDVIVFGEGTNTGVYFEEVVPLNVSSNTYRFTVVPTESDWASTGVYFGGSTGKVVIERVQVIRSEIETDSE